MPVLLREELLLRGRAVPYPAWYYDSYHCTLCGERKVVPDLARACEERHLATAGEDGAPSAA